MLDRNSSPPSDPPPPPGAGLFTRTTFAFLAFVLASLAVAFGNALARPTAVLWGLALACAYAALTGSGITVVEEGPDGTEHLSGQTVGAGVMLIVVANGAFWMAANPRAPMEHGPMPANVPYVMLAFVIAMIVWAVRSQGGRRVARGAALGLGMLYFGGCAGAWSAAARKLDPFPAEKGSRPTVAQLAAVTMEIRECALTYQDTASGRRFPDTRAALGGVGQGCMDAMRNASGNVSIEPRRASRRDEPGTRSIRVAAAGGLFWLPYPRFTIHEDGRVTMVRSLGGGERIMRAR